MKRKIQREGTVMEVRSMSGVFSLYVVRSADRIGVDTDEVGEAADPATSTTIEMKAIRKGVGKGVGKEEGMREAREGRMEQDVSTADRTGHVVAVRGRGTRMVTEATRRGGRGVDSEEEEAGAGVEGEDREEEVDAGDTHLRERTSIIMMMVIIQR